MRNRIIAGILTAVMTVTMAAGCAKTGTGAAADDKKDTAGGTLQIVTTVFPEYDWVRQVVGDVKGVDITLLQKDGTDLHSYQPTVADMAKISDCDLFMYVGGVSSAWADKALKNATNENMVVIDDMKVLGDQVKDEEIKEGMTDTEEHEHTDEAGDTHEQDEHIWLSLVNAETMVEYISEQMQQLDSKNADAYQKNADAYIKKLDDLNTQYEKTVESSKQNTIIVGDRFPFRYLVDDYGIDYFAAFAGCSAETDASFETIVFLAKKIDELSIKDIIVLENSDRKVAESIKNATTNKNQNIVPLNSMQSVKSEDLNKGISYYSIMQDNLKVLQQVLND